MPIEHDQHSDLPPLKIPKPPGIPIEAVAAVERVTLSAGDIPPGILKAFYVRLLGLRFISADEQGLIFSHSRREIFLERGRESVGQAALIIKGFDEALVRLRDASVPYEVLHSDGGMTRTVIVRDPAGNWVRLVETRAF